MGRRQGQLRSLFAHRGASSSRSFRPVCRDEAKAARLGGASEYPAHRWGRISTVSTPQYRPPEWHRPPAGQGQDKGWLFYEAAGWALAVVPIVSLGMLTFVPLLRSGLIRPAQRWTLIGAGLALEVTAMTGFGMVGQAPEDARGNPTGMWSGVGLAVLFISVAVAVVLAVVYRDPVRLDLNQLPAVILAKRARIPLRDAEQIVQQRDVLGGFASVEQAIVAADLPEDTAMRLWDVATV